MTISDAVPHNSPLRAAFLGEGGASPALLLGIENSVNFAIGRDVSPTEAMDCADAMAVLALPRMLEGAPNKLGTCDAVRAVLTELVDLTARYPATADASLVVRLTYDGEHVTVSVGDMGRELPRPEEEPGLYLVHRMAADTGQYAGDHGGRVTWAAIAV
ncbi:ATP-binding protein [Streptomyces zaomyceticus]|uniref:hypothetical protein n=1 Tax=Streptomyces zaomyceticus TaxID=68286 RepID=UPI002E24D4EA